MAELIDARYTHISQTLSRPLSEDELSAVAYHTAKGHAIASWGPSLGIAGALYRIRTTRNEFRWPFYGPLFAAEEAEEGKARAMRWDGERLYVNGKEVFKNASAKAKATNLHVWRGGAYVALGLLIAPMVVSGYAATVSAVGELRDRRLEAVISELKAIAESERRDRKERRGEGIEERNTGSAWRERRERVGGTVNQDTDDMSPTGGGLGFGDEDDQARLSGTGAMSGILGDEQMREREAQAQPTPTRSPIQNRPSTFQIDKVERQPRDFGDDFDEASPTGGSGAAGDTSGASTWDRIRNQSASVSSSTSSRPEPIPTSGRRRGGRRRQQNDDGYSFSSAEEEKSYARDEAQKEFDERVERERRGGDFGDAAGGSGRRW